MSSEVKGSEAALNVNSFFEIKFPFVVEWSTNAGQFSVGSAL